MTDITFLTIAQDSELVIADCLESCVGLGRHIVIDGGSSDRTAELSSQLGADVAARPFEYTAKQYNYALSLVTTTWAFIIDSDERLSASLRQALKDFTGDSNISGYEVPRRNIFLGKEIRHSGWWPDLNVRLLRVKDCRYDDRHVHARIIATGTIAKIGSPLIHLTYTSVEQYVDKLNQYTSFEVKARDTQQTASDRRSMLRRLWLHLPFRPLTRFLYMYIFRLGFLDGRHGLDLAVLSMFYEIVVSIKKRYVTIDDKSNSLKSDRVIGGILQVQAND